uniref:Uncharacterized protein n=1 Tax=Rhizophagus irregularis (strain DAOM 181602 / DAOM 197198 / MUCL 43194) TaxID=747089 RepID=U9T7A8_RHIID
MTKHKKLLHNNIEKHAIGLTFDLERRLDTSPLFNIMSQILDHSPTNLPFYLLIHNLIPTELTSLLYRHFNLERLRLFWELTLGITKLKKKYYYKFHQRHTRSNKRQCPGSSADTTSFELLEWPSTATTSHALMKWLTFDGRLVIFYTGEIGLSIEIYLLFFYFII